MSEPVRLYGSSQVTNYTRRLPRPKVGRQIMAELRQLVEGLEVERAGYFRAQDYLQALVDWYDSVEDERVREKRR